MSKVTYILGAGASRGKRLHDRKDTSETFGGGNIIEGLPVVSEINSRLDFLIEKLRRASLYKDNLSIEQVSKLEELQQTTKSIHELSIRHSTIDTYAKKLYLTQEYNDFELLKRFLSFYLFIEQIMNDKDQRYDSFWANILKNDTSVPEDINIISWNYDSQLELAYREYSTRGLPIASSDDDAQEILSKAKIFKLNGTAIIPKDKYNNWDIALIKGKYSHDKIFTVKDNTSMFSQEFFKFLLLCFNKFYNTDSKIKFAFEGEQNDKFYSAMNQKLLDCETLVVIGYSFPFFNREVDRKVISMMHKLLNIYIQDPNAQEVEQSLKATLQKSTNEISIHLITNTNLFYLPPEL